MIDFFVQHKDAIVTFLTSGTFVSCVIFLVNTILQGGKIARLGGIVEAIPTEIAKIDDVNAKQEALAADVKLLGEKVDAIIEALSLVYATIKDPKTRTAVSAILSNAKHSLAIAKSELVEKLSDLQSELENKSKQSQEELTEVVNKAKDIVQAVRY